MGEPGASGLNVLLFHLAVLKRAEVLCSLVPDSVYGKNLLISVRNEERCKDNYRNDKAQDYDGAHCKGVFHELSHSVLEECGALTHYVLLSLFLIRGFFEHV